MIGFPLYEGVLNRFALEPCATTAYAYPVGMVTFAVTLAGMNSTDLPSPCGNVLPL